MKYEEKFIQGNHSKDYLFEPEGVILHHNYLSLEDLYKQMTERKPVSDVHGPLVPASYHCVGYPDGSRIAFLKDNQRGWHAGTSSLFGREHCNNFTFGYCFYGNSNEVPLTYEQIESFIEWFIPIKEKFNIAQKFLTDHRHVAPKRKVDLNPTELKRVLTATKYLWL